MKPLVLVKCLENLVETLRTVNLKYWDIELCDTTLTDVTNQFQFPLTTELDECEL